MKSILDRTRDFQNHNLKISGQKYNTARGHLKFLQSENGVLSRTSEVVQKQLRNEKERLKELEEIHGVSGFAELQSKLEEVSGMKQKKDQQKGDLILNSYKKVM